jgi:RNA exonuclease 4
LKDARSFQDVRAAVIMLLKNRIVVGHDLQHDFRGIFKISAKALKIRIDPMYVRDTRTIRNLPTPSMKLKDLVKFYLNRSIQKDIHDSAEDAISTLDLYKELKTRHLI